MQPGFSFVNEKNKTVLKFEFNGLQIPTLILQHWNLAQQRIGVFIETGLTTFIKAEGPGKMSTNSSFPKKMELYYIFS